MFQCDCQIDVLKYNDDVEIMNAQAASYGPGLRKFICHSSSYPISAIPLEHSFREVLENKTEPTSP